MTVSGTDSCSRRIPEANKVSEYKISHGLGVEHAILYLRACGTLPAYVYIQMSITNTRNSH